MTSVFHVDIRESGEELKELMSTKRMLASETECVHLCKIGRVQTRRELATLLGYNESTLYRWFCCYQSEGLTGLLQVKTSPGKPSLLPPDVPRRTPTLARAGLPQLR